MILKVFLILKFVYSRSLLASITSLLTSRSHDIRASSLFAQLNHYDTLQIPRRGPYSPSIFSHFPRLYITQNPLISPHKMDTFVVKYRPFKPRAANPPGTTASALKRGAPDSESETRLPKKQKRPYHRHHRLQAPLDLQVEGSVIPDGASVDQLFNFSLGQALREAGFEHADPVALDGFQSCVEARMFIYSWFY